MGLDIKTLSFALLLTFSVQAIAFYLMTMTLASYKGSHWWALGGLFIAMGAGSIFLRSFGAYENLLIMTSNFFQIGGFLFIYIGSKQFFGIKSKNHLLIYGFILYLLIIGFYTFFDRQIEARIIAFSTAMIPLSLLIAWLYLNYCTIAYRKVSIFISILFIINSLFFIGRIIYYLDNEKVSNFFTADIMQSATLLHSICLGFLWTLGLIIVVNQRLNSEIVLKTKELEAMILDKDKFFSILAHDLRGPIATTVSMTELMIDGSRNFSKEDLLRLSVSLNKSANSTNELLENLLEWTGLHRGLKTFSPIKTSFAELMMPFLPTLMETARNKQIAFNNDIPDDTAIFADPHMIQTVFRNLIINAIKFTPEGGCIKLSVHNNENGQMFFSIKDSGIGMDQDTLNTLFRIDFKNNRSGTNGEPSSGLGLLLCKEFIEKHGGSIWVESEVDKGSTFSFNLGKSIEQ